MFFVGLCLHVQEARWKR